MLDWFKSINWDVINWDVVKTSGAGLFIATGPIGGVLIAFGLPQDRTVSVTGALSALFLLVCAIGFIVQQGRKRTDQGKADDISRLSTTGKAAVLAKLPDALVLEAVNNMPDVNNVSVTRTATDGVRTAALNENLDKINFSKVG